MSSFDERLAQERRARLQAERLLAQRSGELYAANRKLSVHAHALSFQVIEQREENAALKGQSSKTEAALEVATEKAQIAERRLWDALTATEDGFAIFDQDWRLVTANPAFLSVFDGLSDIAGGASYEAILRVSVEEGIVDPGDEAPEDWIGRMVARWDRPSIPRADIRLWNGAVIQLIDKKTPQGDIVSLAVDITQTVRREQQLREARDAAEAASRAKSAFLANMSHEIRTPMNGVVSMADLLRDSALTEEQQLYADTIRNSGEALLVIINDVLDYSKIEAGKLQLHKDSFDLDAMVREIFQLMRPALDGKPIELRLDYDIFLPDRMIGDRVRVRQVLTNLIGNAVKFTERGAVTVRVVGDPPTADGPEVPLRIVVEDTGCGIAPEMQAHVFGEFNQVEDQANRRHDGTGLGLAISRRLVTLMGGEMWLQSEVGRGSAFGFRLTFERDPAARTDPVATLPPDRNRVLVIGTIAAGLGAMLDLLKAEVTLIRRLPTARDLAEMQAVILGSGGPDAAAVGRALDSLGFARARIGGGEPAPGWAGLSDGVRPPELLRCLLAEDPIPVPTVAPVRDAPVTAIAPRPVRRPRLLAAEDNKTNQLVFKTMLKTLDLDVDMVENGLQLLEAYRRAPPDLVMTDISMPEMDGLEAARLIRAFEAQQGQQPVRIIAMTAHAMEGDKERILAAGIDDYLTKPLKKADLHALIAEALGQALVVAA